MIQVRKRQALAKVKFHQRLRQWYQGTREQIVGPDWVDGRTRWIYVEDATNYRRAMRQGQPAKWKSDTLTA